jgi:hypothetical protein
MGLGAFFSGARRKSTRPRVSPGAARPLPRRPVRSRTNPNFLHARA